MAGYERLGTASQRREAAVLRVRIARAEQVSVVAELAGLRREVVAAEARARLLESEALGTVLERAELVRVRALLRWPDSRVLGPQRLAAAVRDVELYAAEHPGGPRRQSKPPENPGRPTYRTHPDSPGGEHPDPKHTHPKQTHHTPRTENHTMTRTRQSAKAAGTTFERQTADYLAHALDDDAIDRQIKTGGKDKGDIRGVKIHGQRIAIECKNTTKPALAGWAAEAETERGNLDALAGVTIHKRHGKGRPADQWVTLTLRDFAAILTGTRPEET